MRCVFCTIKARKKLLLELEMVCQVGKRDDGTPVLVVQVPACALHSDVDLDVTRVLPDGEERQRRLFDV